MRLRRLLRSERGMALPLTLLVVATIGVLVTSSLNFSSSSGRTANVAKGRVSAESLAEAGIAAALAVLNNSNNNPSNSSLLGCNSTGTSCTPTVSAFNEGTATWSGWLDGSGGTSTWRLTSVGQVANPTGPVALKRTIKADVPLVQQQGTPNASVWNYIYSSRAPGSGCEVDINGTNVVVDIPLYVTGDLCLSGTNVAIDERGEGQVPAPQPIDLRVGGKLVFGGNNATVGVSSDYLTSAAVGGGCATTIGGAAQTCARPPFNWYVSTVNTFSAITPPPVDYNQWYNAHDTINSTSTVAGQGGDCDIRIGTPPAINPDTLLNANAGTVILTPASAYTCKKTSDGSPTSPVVSELSWDGSSVLTIKGVIVVDGAVTFNDSNATYVGSATIYANGAFNQSGSNAKMCANATCDFTTWNPNANMLILVATSVAMNGSNNKWQGGLYCPSTATADFSGSNVVIQGPVICGRLTFGSNTEFKPLPAITQLPVGAPVEYNVSVGPGKPVYGGG